MATFWERVSDPVHLSYRRSRNTKLGWGWESCHGSYANELIKGFLPENIAEDCDRLQNKCWEKLCGSFAEDFIRGVLQENIAEDCNRFQLKFIRETIAE